LAGNIGNGSVGKRILNYTVGNFENILQNGMLYNEFIDRRKNASRFESFSITGKNIFNEIALRPMLARLLLAAIVRSVLIAKGTELILMNETHRPMHI
jgi:hypothetical protein